MKKLLFRTDNAVFKLTFDRNKGIYTLEKVGVPSDSKQPIPTGKESKRTGDEVRLNPLGQLILYSKRGFVCNTGTIEL